MSYVRSLVFANFTCVFLLWYGLGAAQSVGADNYSDGNQSQTLLFEKSKGEPKDPVKLGEYYLHNVRIWRQKPIATVLKIMGTHRLVTSTETNKAVLHLNMYTNLHAEDIMPINNALFKVTELNIEAGTVTLRCLDDDKELQDSVGVAKKSIVVTLGGDIFFLERRLSIMKFFDKPTDKRRAVQLGYYGTGESAEPEVVEGNDVSIAGHRYTVRRIVPPDADKHIVGWVELLPDDKRTPNK